MSNDCSSDAPELSTRFVFWLPPAGAVVHCGADHHPVALPCIPLPVDPAALTEGPPDDNAIGEGIYAYLREHPDCLNGSELACLLRDAYPHYIADLGAQIVMLDRKEVDPPYVLRKVRYLKILALLEPENAGLHIQIGKGFYHLGTSFSELLNAEGYLLQAMKHLSLACEIAPGDLSSLNLLAEIDFLFGDFPSALQRWRAVVEGMEQCEARCILEARIARVETLGMPDRPLVDELHSIGEAMELCGAGEYADALALLEAVEENGTVLQELASAEFFYLLALCRSRTGDAGGAFVALESSLAMNPGFAPALEGRIRLQDSGRI